MTMSTQLWQLLLFAILRTLTIGAEPIPGPKRVGCREKAAPASWVEERDGNFRELCKEQVKKNGADVCNGLTLLGRGNCISAKVPGHNCCEWGNTIFDADKQSQHAKFNHIAAYLSYTEQEVDPLRLLTDKTIIKYTRFKNLYALKIDETKLNALTVDHTQTFQTDGARSSALKLGLFKKGQVEITTSDIVQAINNDKTKDAINGQRVDSRVNVSITGSKLGEKDRPFSRVGNIWNIKYNDKTSCCTGTLISDKIVLLAAHCLIAGDIILPVEDIKFYPHRSEAVGKGTYETAYPGDTSFDAVAVYFYYGYYRLDLLDPTDMPGKADWDIALIELASSMKSNYGYLAYGVPSDDKIEEYINSITIGYPSTKGNLGRTNDVKGLMFKAFAFAAGRIPKEINDIDEGFKGYEKKEEILATQIFPMQIIDNKYATAEGQSGSSVFHWDSTINQYVAFCVVSAGRNRGGLLVTHYQTYFTRITYEKGLQIQDIINAGVDSYVKKVHSAEIELEVTAPVGLARIHYHNMYDVYDNMHDYEMNEMNGILLPLFIMDSLLMVIAIGCCVLLVIAIFCGIYFAEDFKGFIFNMVQSLQ